MLCCGSTSKTIIIFMGGKKCVRKWALLSKLPSEPQKFPTRNEKPRILLVIKPNLCIPRAGDRLFFSKISKF